MFHAELESTHAIRPRFLERLLVGPVVMRDPVTGDNGTCSIGSTAAMHEDPSIGIQIQQRQEPEDGGFGWRVQLGQGFADVLHAGSLYCLRFGRDGVLASQTQVDYLLHSKLGQARPTCIGGLATTVHMLVDLVKIGNAQRFDVGCMRLEPPEGRGGAQNELAK